MKYRITIIIFIGFLSFSFFGQNLINNGSAEILHSCPTNLNQIDSSFFWSKGSGGTPDLFSMCSSAPIFTPPNIYYGYQKPRTGRSLIGLAFNVFYSWPNSYSLLKEYPRIELSQPLVSNVVYNVRCYLSNTGFSYSGSNAITGDSLGFLFLINDTVFNTGGNIPQVPQVWDTSGFYIDTVNWLEVEGIYIAQGGEKYLIIGDFKRYDLNPNYYITSYVGPYTSTSTYYYLDDVAIWPADTVPPPADAGQDTTICKGGKARLGTHNYSDYIYEWSPSITLSNDSGGVVWASPDTTTTYYLQATDDIFTKTMDSVTVYVNNCGQNDTVVCIEQQFTMGSTNNPNWHYQWSPSAGLSSDTVGMPLCSLLSNQSYQLLITNSTGDTIALDSTTVLVGSCYYADAGIDSLICKGDSLVIGMQNLSFLDFKWWPNFMISDTAVGNPSVWPDTLTWYYLQLTDTMGNVSLDSVLVDVQICAGINTAFPFENGIRVYPNPATEQITIEFENQVKSIDITIINIFGQTIIHQQMSGNSKYNLNISNLESGMYFYSIISNGKVLKSDKLIKQ
jgi:hypothetical protein